MRTFAKVLLAGTAMIMVGCSTIVANNSDRLCATADGDFYRCNDLELQANRPANTVETAQSRVNFQILSEYTEQMAADMQKDLRATSIVAPIAVASFVGLDNSLEGINNLGKQLADYFINDLQAIGLPVSNYQLNGNTDITAQGDIAARSDLASLYKNKKVGYLLTGTMIKNQRGIIVNARLMSLSTKVVVASASKLLPNIVVNNL